MAASGNAQPAANNTGLAASAISANEVAAVGSAPSSATNTALVTASVHVKDIQKPSSFIALLDDEAIAGRGTATLLLDQGKLFYRITVNDLSGPITAAHFHNGPVGASGVVVRDLDFSGQTTAGTWSMDEQDQPFTAVLVKELLAGRIYINVHTQANPAGEIRGQVQTLSDDGFAAYFGGGQVVLSPLSVEAPPGATAPQVDRVGFPSGYQEDFQPFYSMDRLDNNQVRKVFANDIAAAVELGQPYPFGSVLVLEPNFTGRDVLGHVVRDDQGRFSTTARPFVFVMRKEPGFGEAFGNIRNSEWEYAAYRQDGNLLFPIAGTTGCATCHLSARASNDYVFRTGLAFATASSGRHGRIVDGEWRIALPGYRFKLERSGD
jgi:hypothetical protein